MIGPKSRFLPGVPASEIEALLRSAPGNELDSGKFDNPNSSSALAVNTFGLFLDKPQMLPSFSFGHVFGEARRVSVETEMRFPWSGGKHPWLDAALWTDTHLIGIESKRYEPYRGRKTVKLSNAYNRDLWGERMKPYEDIRDGLRSADLRFKFLDAAQLVKHAFGLVTQGKKNELSPILIYLYAEPKSLDGKSLSDEMIIAHKKEVADFSRRVSGAEVQFFALSYKELLATWYDAGGDVERHARNITERFDIIREDHP